MALTAGTRLGPYEVLGLIGAGGMGEVYQAKDTRLNRTVAIKVIPAEISSDPDRRARFEREAKAIATLSHPNICTLHDVGEREGVMFLVMEHLEGHTLAERLGKGALPIEQALEIGAQIAEALSVAHHAGIVHRDLKPANVMLTKAGVKLLDFGLAKFKRGAVYAAATSSTLAPTQSELLSGAGTILGTLQYIAPEQLEGKETDARTDVFSLGLVVYEMVTGRRAFQAESQAGLIAAILEKDPVPIAQVVPLTPLALDRAVRKCLQKDPAKRWQTAWDAADELRWIASGIGSSASSGGVAASRQHKRAWFTTAFTLAAGLVVGLITGAALWKSPSIASPANPGGVEHLAIPVSTWHLTLEDSDLVVSADGRLVVFAASENSRSSRLYVREMNGVAGSITQPKAIEGTEGARYPFISPDGKHIAFQSGNALRRVSISGGRVQKICDTNSHGGDWLADGTIVFGGGYRLPGIWSVPAEGGTPRLLFQPSSASGATFYNFPEVLPGGKGILFTTYQKAHFSLRVWSKELGERVLLDQAGEGRFVAPGYLVYAFENDLRVVPFDAERLELRGASRVVAEVVPESTQRATWAISRTGTLVYYPTYIGLLRLVWRDRYGTMTTLPLRPRRFTSFSLAPDGDRLVVAIDEGARRRLWIGSVGGEPLTPLTHGPDDVFNTFSSDGKWVAFTRNVNGHYNIFRVATDGTGKVEQLAASDEQQGQPEFHPRGSTIVFNFGSKPAEMHIWQKPLDPPGPLQPLVNTPGVTSEWSPRFSSDGHWLAYISNANGISEIYVQEFSTGKRMQLSVDGGMNPVWNPRGGELFYRAGRSLMAVQFVDGRRGPVSRLFEEDSGGLAMGISRGEPGFEVDRLGRRFLMLEPLESATYPSQLYVLRNWLEDLTTKMPLK